MGWKGEHQVKVSTRTCIGTYLHDGGSIHTENNEKTKSCQQVLERKINTSLELIKVVNSST
jgi:hypothetical protein